MFAPWGVVKCGLSKGHPFVDLVTLDDYFIDLSPDRIDQIDYEGNDYWVNYEDIMEDDKYVNKDELKPDERTPMGPHGENRSQNVTHRSTADTFKDKKWLRDVWLEDEGLLVTYAINDKKVIREADLDELKHSPYYRLSYNDVPGQIVPLPQVALWRDLHELGNSLFRKLANGADSEKTCLGFPNDEESVNNFKNARDGDGLRFNGQKPEKLQAGGINPQTMMFFLQVKDLMSYFAGNLDSLGGLGAMTETATQDKLIGDAANAQLDDMGTKTVDEIRSVFQALSYYEYTDPTRKRILQKKIPGTDLTIPVEFGPSQRQNTDWDSLYFDVDVFSMQYDVPSVKLQKLRAFMQEFILPMAPMIEAAGGVIDFKKILKLAGQYANFDEIEELVVFIDDIQQPAVERAAHGAPQNRTTTQNYSGSPGPSPKSQNAQMMQTLLQQSVSS
jgi:hypothetical protein